MNKLIQFYNTEEIVRPEYWGGYGVQPKEIEFWQGRDNRLHDRLRYTRIGKSWNIYMLAP